MTLLQANSNFIDSICYWERCMRLARKFLSCLFVMVLAGTLAWTGNFRFLFDVDERNTLRIVSGINPYRSAYSLEIGRAHV